jgi:hypothetical protein
MCENRVGYWFTRSNGTSKEYFVRCGNTDPYGGRAVCDDCAGDAGKRAEIERAEASIRADNAASRAAGWGDW